MTGGGAATPFNSVILEPLKRNTYDRSRNVPCKLESSPLCHSRAGGNPVTILSHYLSGLSGQARPHGHGASVMTGDIGVTSE